jgi:deoxyribonuclease I
VRKQSRGPRQKARRRLLWRVLILALVGGCGAPGEPRTPEPGPSRPRVSRSFEQAKRLAWIVYRDHRVALYCPCAFDARHRVQSGSCGYRPRNPGPRAQRIEWEHLVSAYELGAHRACWQGKTCADRRGHRYGGRLCCRERDPQFRRMEADLMNLSPELGELNADRSNFSFGDVPGEAREYGACDFEIDRARHVAEPPPSARGDIARAYLYMHEVYGDAALPLSPAQLRRFEAWHREDPPSDWERVRNQRIRALQGVGNPWIER